MKELSTSQAKLLDALKRLTLAKGKPPTMQELADELHFQPPSVYNGLLRLKEKGFVRRRQGKWHSVKIIK